MAFVIADRVRETTTTTGTGTINLGGAVTNFETFTANLSNGDTTYYAIVDNTNNAFEVGLGTFATGSPNTLARTTIIASSNSNSAVTLGSGTKDVFITIPASKLVVEDGSNNVAIGGTVTATAFSGSGASLTGVDVVNDTSPQLGGALDVQTHDIVTTSNRDLELAPNGTGKVVVKGNTNQGAIQFNCEANSHGQIVIAAPHSESASNTLTLPSTGGDARLVSTASTATLTNKTFGDNVSFGDNNITNVGDIAVDSISPDGTDINVAVSDNSATAFTIKQSTNNYLVIDTGDGGESVAIGTGVSGTAISIGHTTSETTVNDNLTVTGNLTVSGTTTTVDSTTINIQNAFVFEGATANDFETTLTTVDPTADRTISLPNQSGTVALTSDIPSSGISSGNVATFTSGVADNDFLRVDGTSVEGRSASEVLSDIGGQASLTFGISNTNAVKIDSSSVADDEFARFTANGLESRSASEVADDIGAATKGFATAMAIAL